MSPVLTRTPAGTPSQIATSARPCDSPAVSHRNMVLILWGRCESRSGGGDAELDAAAQPPGQAGRDAARGPVHHRFPVTDGEGQPDRQVGPVHAACGQLK